MKGKKTVVPINTDHESSRDLDKSPSSSVGNGSNRDLNKLPGSPESPSSPTAKEKKKEMKKKKKKEDEEDSKYVSVEEHLGEDFLNTPWVKPTKERAERYRENNMFNGGNSSIWKTSTDDLGALGVGVGLYFVYLKYFTIMFLILTITASPSLYYASQGNRIPTQDLDPLGFSASTVGNIGNPENSNRNGLWPSSVILKNGQVISEVSIAYLITFGDFVGTTLFIVFCIWLFFKTSAIVRDLDNKNVTCSDYSIMVEHLPSDATESEVLDHFNKLYDLSVPDWEHNSAFLKKKARDPVDIVDRGYVIFNKDALEMSQIQNKYPPTSPTGAKQILSPKGNLKKPTSFLVQKTVGLKTVSDVSNSLGTNIAEKPDYMNKWIAEVILSHPWGSKLRHYLNTEALTTLLHRKRAEIKKYNEGSEFEDEKKRAVEEGFLAQLEDVLKKEATKMKDSVEDKKCVNAFVIFNHEESLIRCLDDYYFSSSWWRRKWFQPTPLKFRGKFPIRVTAASEPGDVIWENLETSTRDKYQRRCTGNFITFILLIICMAMIAVTQGKKSYFADQSPKFAFCNSELPAIFYGTYNGTAGALLIHNQNLDAECNDIQDYYLSYANANATLAAEYTINVNNTRTHKMELVTLVNETLVSPCSKNCINPGDTTKCLTFECLQQAGISTCSSYPQDTIVGCFCTQQLQSQIKSKGYLNAITWINNNERGLCDSFIVSYALAQSLTIGSAILVPAVNVILKSILASLANFERYNSASSLASSISFKIFMAQFLNLAIVTIIVQARGIPGITLPGHDPPPIAVVLGVFNGKYYDFTIEWYALVGGPIVLSIFINIFVPHSAALFDLVTMYFRRALFQKNANMQHDLNQLYVGEHFSIESRFPIILTNIFVAFFFGSGMPILYPLCFFALFLTYWVDKALVIKVYHKPRSYDETLANLTLSLMPYCIILHLMIAIWMYGSNDVFYDSSGGTGLVSASSYLGNIQSLTPDQIKPLYLNWENNLINNGDTALILPRLLRYNTIPLVILLLLVVGVFALYNFLGKVVLLPILIRLLTYFKLLDSKKSQAKEWNPPFTEFFSREMDPFDFQELSKVEKENGWESRIEETEDGGKFYRLIKRWNKDSNVDGVKRFDGQMKRTWEVCQDNGLATYDLARNPKYKKAMEGSKAMENLVRAEEDSEEEDSEEELSEVEGREEKKIPPPPDEDDLDDLEKLLGGENDIVVAPVQRNSIISSLQEKGYQVYNNDNINDDPKEKNEVKLPASLGITGNNQALTWTKLIDESSGADYFLCSDGATAWELPAGAILSAAPSEEEELENAFS